MALEPHEVRRIERVARCFDASGRLLRWPSKRAEQILALWVLWSFLPAETRFSEAEFNAVLRDWHGIEDYALVRRDLCDLELMRRTPTGSVYRRAEHDTPAEVHAVLQNLQPARA